MLSQTHTFPWKRSPRGSWTDPVDSVPAHVITRIAAEERSRAAAAAGRPIRAVGSAPVAAGRLFLSALEDLGSCGHRSGKSVLA